ncbi:MAG: dihydrodipicolinate synthase family protein [Lachnospiraceae bacterium]|nr:dihydrodipicolinate synthase family protein [Lachnospiraceae bacterium]
MLTPFTVNNEVDYEALDQLITWYIKEGVSGLFAVTQSSEMFYLSGKESEDIARFVVEKAAGRVPVIASGHVADDLREQADSIIRMGSTGVDAVILITNRLADQTESDEVWLDRMQWLLKQIPEHIRLGLYECPYPYKRILSAEVTKWCAHTGRFYFLKDTSCDMESIRKKLEVMKGTNLQLYNANSATLLESLKAGAVGYSGVMANMQCRLYVELCRRYREERMRNLEEELTMCALIERQLYPVNAKYYLRQEGIPITTKCRAKDDSELTETYKLEMRMLRNITERMECEYL